MLNIKLTVAYDGTRFLGWQKTNLDPMPPSVEYVMQETLAQILQHPVHVQAASITDRGVHAEGQIVNFIIQKDVVDIHKLQISLNALLPEDIRVLQVSIAEPNFHATLSSKAKQYVYRLYTGPVMLPALRFTHWHVPQALDREKMLSGAHILLGEHDFAAFRNHRKGNDYNDTVRNIMSIDFHDVAPHVLEIRVTGNNFLYKMCRNIVGTLVYIGQGKISPGHLAQILSDGQRSDNGITAPAHGLSLCKVYYTDVSNDCINTRFL